MSPLPNNYLASIFGWPLRYCKPNYNTIPATSSAYNTTFTPELLARHTITDASTIDDDGVSAAHASPNTATVAMTIGGAFATGGVATLPTQPRGIIITVTHGSSIVAVSGVITGTDWYGKTITEAWSVTATGTSKTYASKKAFRTITGITEIAATDASANTCKVGDSKVFGLPFKATNIVPKDELEDGATPTAGVIVAGAGSSATADWRGTYAPNSTANGAKDFTFTYTVTDPTDIGTA